MKMQEEKVMAEFFDVLENRSSIRKFTDEEVSEQMCQCLIEAGLKAPTATNRQEIHISVVRGNDLLQKEIQRDLDPEAKVNFYYDAPLVFYLSGEDAFRWSDVDAGIAVENMHLAAEALGLGSVILGCMKKVLCGDKKEGYDRKLSIPQGYSFRIALAVGHPAAEKKRHDFDLEKNVTVI